MKIRYLALDSPHFPYRKEASSLEPQERRAEAAAAYPLDRWFFAGRAGGLGFIYLMRHGIDRKGNSARAGFMYIAEARVVHPRVREYFPR